MKTIGNIHGELFVQVGDPVFWYEDNQSTRLGGVDMVPVSEITQRATRREGVVERITPEHKWGGPYVLITAEDGEGWDTCPEWFDSIFVKEVQ